MNQHIAQADVNRLEPLAAQEMFSAAKKQQSRAAGIDGWHGNIFFTLPLIFWSAVTRQTHLPKPGKGVRASDQAIRVSSLRPVSVLSSWYRVHATARWRSPSVQTWIDSWWPSTSFGGRKGKSTHDASDVVLFSADMGQYVAAFDYSLAFDLTQPSLATYVLRCAGMPHQWATLLPSLWSRER